MKETTGKMNKLLCFKNFKNGNYRGDKEKLKHIEKKVYVSQEDVLKNNTGTNCDLVPAQFSQASMNNGNSDSYAERNFRIVSDEFVRELMKKYGREIRRG